MHIHISAMPDLDQNSDFQPLLCRPLWFAKQQIKRQVHINCRTVQTCEISEGVCISFGKFMQVSKMKKTEKLWTRNLNKSLSMVSVLTLFRNLHVFWMKLFHFIGRIIYSLKGQGQRLIMPLSLKSLQKIGMELFRQS